MPKRDLAWHQQDIADELAEYKEAKGFIFKWSEISDVVYTYTRAHWSGHKEVKFPLSQKHFYFGLLYMFPKYTLRWTFFRVLGNRLKSKIKLTEVRNPTKIHKLDHIANKYNLNPEVFKTEALKLMKFWPFLY